MKDYYEDLVRFFEFQMGSLPHRGELKQALRATLSEQDLQVFFLLPFIGMISEAKLERRASKIGLPPAEVCRIARRLVPEGIVDSYMAEEGRVYGRAPLIALLEFQVRLKDDSPMRAVCTRIMNDFIDGKLDLLPTKTPYYRVLPVEPTITAAPAQTRRVTVNAVVPDPRQVLPIDVVSEMIKREPLIIVADCYCRSSRALIGQGCDHPRETCFYFGELGKIKVEAGYARQVSLDEALAILRQCEEAGLVHNVSNCEGQIQTLCNCCPCCCGVLNAVKRGYTNAGAPSRYQAALQAEACTLCGACVEVCPVGALTMVEGELVLTSERCIGCGLCVSRCAPQALRLELRSRAPKIYSSNDALFRRINIEAMAALAWRKVSGR